MREWMRAARRGITVCDFSMKKSDARTCAIRAECIARQVHSTYRFYVGSVVQDDKDNRIIVNYYDLPS